MTCKKCLARGKTWKGDDPVCGFEDTVFSILNYQCATVNDLRSFITSAGKDSSHLGYVKLTTTSGDESYATIDVHDVFNYRKSPSPVALYVGWYKNRGRTQSLWLMFETDAPRIPTLQEVEDILKYFNK